MSNWPDRIVYVCSAGGAANVNLVPMMHAGQSRVVGVVILAGLSNPNQPTPSDHTFAIEPANRIHICATEALNIKPENILVLRGHADLIGDWMNALALAGAMANRLDAEIVFNITGGRVASKIGLILSLRHHTGQPVSLISVGLNGGTVRRLQFLENGAIDESPVPMEWKNGLSFYLKCYGLEEVEQAGRNAVEAKFCEETYGFWLKALTAFMVSDKAPGDIGCVMHAITESRKNKVPLKITLPTDVIKRLRPLFAILDITCSGNSVQINSHDSKDFIMGLWLEATVFLEMKQLMTGLRDSEIAARLTFKRKGNSNRESDFDVVTICNDVLGLVECKAVTTSRDLGPAIDKLARYRQELMGHGGRAFIVAPLLNQEKIALLRKKSNAANVTIFFGPTALEQLLEEMKRLYKINATQGSQ